MATSFTQQINRMCARHCLRSWGHGKDKPDKSPHLIRTDILVGVR
jgi:hypothetical protein